MFQAFSSFTQSTGGIAHALTSHGVVANSHFLYSAQENICFCFAKQFFSNLLFTSTFFKRSHKQRYNPFYFNFFFTFLPYHSATKGLHGLILTLLLLFLLSQPEIGGRPISDPYTSIVIPTARHSFRALETGLNSCSIGLLLGIHSRDTISCYH